MVSRLSYRRSLCGPYIQQNNYPLEGNSCWRAGIEPGTSFLVDSDISKAQAAGPINELAKTILCFYRNSVMQYFHSARLLCVTYRRTQAHYERLLLETQCKHDASKWRKEDFKVNPIDVAVPRSSSEGLPVFTDAEGRLVGEDEFLVVPESAVL